MVNFTKIISVTPSYLEHCQSVVKKKLAFCFHTYYCKLEKCFVLGIEVKVYKSFR